MTSAKPRREFLRRAAVVGLGIFLSPPIRWARAQQLDIIVRGGSVVDGLGNRPFTADIGVLGERIVAIGALESESAARTIDARGLTVGPGFIDVHAHTNLLQHPKAQSKIYQGVTLDVTGPDGGSAFPRAAESGEMVGFREWADQHRATPIAMNVSSYVGHGTIRRLVLGYSPRAPNPSELATMQDLAREAMEAGAVGLSSGLEYDPASYATTEEVVALAKIAADYGGIYATHQRHEDEKVLESTEEAIRIQRESGARLLLTHLKLSGSPNWPKVDRLIEQIENARAEGLDVHCNRYPYIAYQTGLSIFYPGWAKENDTFQESLADPARRAEMKPEVVSMVESNGGWESLMIVRTRGSGHDWSPDQRAGSGARPGSVRIRL